MGAGMGDLGAALRAARVSAGVSLSVLASRTHYSKSLLGLLEIGRRTARPEHVHAYARALDMPVGLLFGPSDDPLRLAHEWLVSESPSVIQCGAGRRVGAGLAGELERRVIELRRLDDVLGGHDLFPLVSAECAELSRLLAEASFTESVGRRLLMVAGELAQLAGWVASDAGRYLQAQHHYLAGVAVARAAAERALGAQLLSSLSYQLANLGERPADAALLAHSAVAGAPSATPMVRTLLLERAAWASARAGDREATWRALGAADDTFEHRSTSVVEPDWVYWLDRAEMDIMAGRCLIELGDPGSAEPLLLGAIAGYDISHARELALYLSWLAESYARAGELDAARATLVRADRHATPVRSARLERRIADVEQL
ncbi:MAG TPA: helix-turn-helix transcriptional regulator, partial [Pseudonocardia sp.]